METQKQKQVNVGGGLFAALIFLLLVGVFVGLPVIVWVFLGAALVGLWVAHFYDRDRSSETVRPWQRS
jgi:predicted membrane metal-binding protein